MSVSAVYSVTGTSDESYPRLQYAHPRNRSIDWLDFRDYYGVRGRPGEKSFNLFLKARKRFDSIWIIGVGLVLSPRLRQTLEPLVGGPVTFLPVGVNDEPFWFMRVEHVIDALDVSRSDYKTDSPGQLYALSNETWFGDRIPDPSIFKIPQVSWSIWATQSVFDAYRASGCNGLIFAPAGTVV
jgi:hypothetical protein